MFEYRLVKKFVLLASVTDDLTVEKKKPDMESIVVARYPEAHCCRSRNHHKYSHPFNASSSTLFLHGIEHQMSLAHV